MKEIQLEELLKSKEFMKHVQIADGLSKETGLEHGFRFCKPNDEIIVDKMCIGDKCSIKITSEKCDIHDNKFHTHPKAKKAKSKFSVADIYSSAWCSSVSKKPHITCVKATHDDNILCNKSEVRNKKIVLLAKDYKEDIKKGYDTPKRALHVLHLMIKPETILFDSKTGKIIKD